MVSNKETNGQWIHGEQNKNIVDAWVILKLAYRFDAVCISDDERCVSNEQKHALFVLVKYNNIFN